MAFEQVAPPRTRASVGVRAFLIADVRGYTRFTQEHGDTAATRLALRFAALVHEELAGADGELLGLRGDEAAVAFGSVRQALRTALALQDRFARELAADPALPLRVGMGLDAGEAVAVTDGYRGMALNVAARLCAAAPAGVILITESLAHLAGAVEGVAYLDHARLTLKGLAAPVRVLELLPARFVALLAAPDDGAHSERLREDLRARGVALWAVPPTSDPGEGEPGVRGGVRASHAVLLLGTPRVARARPVKVALGIAQLYRRPVVAVWIEGDDGEAEQVAVEAIDLRGERYGAGWPRSWPPSPTPSHPPPPRRSRSRSATPRRATRTRGCAPSGAPTRATSSGARGSSANWSAACVCTRGRGWRASWRWWGRAARASPASSWPGCSRACGRAPCPAAPAGSTSTRWCPGRVRWRRWR